MSESVRPEKRRPRGYWTRRILLFVAALPFVLGLCGWLLWTKYERDFYMDKRPLEAGLQQIVFKQTKTYGFGPGGNETGIVIYKWDEASVAEFKADPSAFLAGIPKSGERCQNYRDWSETPMIGLETNDMTGTIEGEPVHIDSYLNRYGFGLELPSSIHAMLNAALATPGNYYGGSRCGLFIFMPDEERGAYIFVG